MPAGLVGKESIPFQYLLSLCRLEAFISASATVEAAILVNFHGRLGLKKQATKYVSV